MTAVWQMQLSHTDKLVLLALADNASDEGVCWPSVPTLMRKTCLSRRGVQAAVARLQAEGHLGRVFRDGRSTNYLIKSICGGPETVPAHAVRPPARNMRPTRAYGAPTPAHAVRPEPSYRTIREPFMNPRGGYRARRRPESGTEAAADYIENELASIEGMELE